MPSNHPIYGIKLVANDHFRYECFRDSFEGHDGLCTLMNFKNNPQGKSAANRLVPGSQAIIYMSKVQSFVAAFEVCGNVQDGKKIAKLFSHGEFDLLASTNPYNIFLPIRWLARAEEKDYEYRIAVCERAEIQFKPNSFTFKGLSEEDYRRLFSQIKWSWMKSTDRTTFDTVWPGRASTVEDATAHDLSIMLTDKQSPVDEEWYPALVERIHQVAPLPERNHEAVVSDFLQRLGVNSNQIIFQQGRIDISVAGSNGQVCMIIEVKQNLNVTNQIARAREQAEIYGTRVGCSRCAITDGDLWELHDLSRGQGYDQRYLGAFRLTKFRDQDTELYGLLYEWLQCE